MAEAEPTRVDERDVPPVTPLTAPEVVSPVAGPEVATARTAPPTVRGEMRVNSPRRSKWPAVLGIFCIVVGAGGVLIHGWGVIQNLWMPQWFSGIPEQAAFTAVMKKWAVPMAVSSATSGMLAALLIVGGVQLFRKRAGARGLLLSWAVVRVIQGVGAAIAMGLMQEEQMRVTMTSASGQGGPPAAVNVAIGSATGVVTVTLYSLWAIALPAFVIVWMMLPRVRREMSSWRSEGRR